MGHLLAIKHNLIDFEKKIKRPTSENYKGKNNDPVRLAYKIGDYWFYLTLKDWAFHRNFSVATIRNRYRTRHYNNKTVGQILGFEEMKYTKKKPEGYDG